MSEEHTVIFNRTAHVLTAPNSFLLDGTGLTRFSIITDLSGSVSASRVVFDPSASLDAVVIRPSTEFSKTVDYPTYRIQALTGQATIIAWHKPVKVEHNKPISTLGNDHTSIPRHRRP